jgi:hypothetical protein
MGSPPPPCAAWFGDARVKLVPLGATGFSGSQVLLAHPPGMGERYVLKSFAAGVSVARAGWVHALMRHLHDAGIAAVPKLIECRPESRHGAGTGRGDRMNTLAADPTGTLWELMPFMPGSPRSCPTISEAVAALETLARLHRAAATLPGEPRSKAQPACLHRRIEQARAMLERPWAARRVALGERGDPAIARCLDEAVSIFTRAGGERVVRHVADLKPQPMHVQPVLRDIWSDHVLFDDVGGVAAVIDYHAAAIDSPATDLARLLGSWGAAAGEGPLLDRWRPAVAAYETIRRLDDAERLIVPLLHATGVVFGLENWFRWTLDEDRSFPDWGRVRARVAALVAGLEAAIVEAAKSAGNLD